MVNHCVNATSATSVCIESCDLKANVQINSKTKCVNMQFKVDDGVDTNLLPFIFITNSTLILQKYHYKRTQVYIYLPIMDPIYSTLVYALSKCVLKVTPLWSTFML